MITLMTLLQFADFAFYFCIFAAILQVINIACGLTNQDQNQQQETKEEKDEEKKQ